MTKAQEFLAMASKFGALLFKQKGEVMPMFDIEDSDGNHTVIVTAWRNQTEKDMVIDEIRRVLREKQAVRYAFMSEVWAANISAEDKEGAKLGMALARAGRLSEYEDRIEALLITVEDRETSEKLARQYQILRPEHGKPTLSPPKDLEHDGSTGRMVGLFERD